MTRFQKTSENGATLLSSQLLNKVIEHDSIPISSQLNYQLLTSWNEKQLYLISHKQSKDAIKVGI